MSSWPLGAKTQQMWVFFNINASKYRQQPAGGRPTNWSEIRPIQLWTNSVTNTDVTAVKWP